MRSIFAVFSILISFALASRPSIANEVVFYDPAEIQEKFETSLTIVKEYLEVQDPPKYFLYKAAVEFAETTGADGNVGGKIPVGVFEVSFEGEYGRLKTSRTTYEYVPRSSIPVNFEDLGISEFLSELQKKIQKDLRSADFLVKRAERSEEFVIVTSVEGKLEFLAVASFAASADKKNSHRMTFYFCLLGNDGDCVQ